MLVVIYKWRESAGLQTVTDQDKGAVTKRGCRLIGTRRNDGVWWQSPTERRSSKDKPAQFLSPGEGADSGHLARIGFCVNPLKLSRLRSGNSAFRFPPEIICEQAAAHLL
jgi:hypothetical protein